jgi:insulysin
VTYAEMAEEILASKPIAPSSVPELALLLPEGMSSFVESLDITDIAPGSNYVWTMPVVNPNEPNSSLTYFLHLGDLSDARLRVTAALLVQLLSEPAFNILRTQEQLGYIVHCSQAALARDTHAGLKLVVQSERRPAYLEERVEAFLASQAARLADMPAEEFAEQKAGLKRKWLERLKNMREETNRYWKYLEAGHLDFYRRKIAYRPLHP